MNKPESYKSWKYKEPSEENENILLASIEKSNALKTLLSTSYNHSIPSKHKVLFDSITNRIINLTKGNTIKDIKSIQQSCLDYICEFAEPAVLIYDHENRCIHIDNSIRIYNIKISNEYLTFLSWVRCDYMSGGGISSLNGIKDINIINDHISKEDLERYIKIMSIELCDMIVWVTRISSDIKLVPEHICRSFYVTEKSSLEIIHSAIDGLVRIVTGIPELLISLLRVNYEPKDNELKYTKSRS